MKKVEYTYPATQKTPWYGLHFLPNPVFNDVRAFGNAHNALIPENQGFDGSAP